MPKIDVIIPAYNAAKFLVQALESVVAQTFEDWRVILVDDGSTDATAAIAQTYAERLGSRMKYVYQENKGLPTARNTAIRHGDAELLALLDADDVWLPRRLEKSIEAHQGKPDVGLSYGFIDRIDSDGAILDTFTNVSRHAEGHIAPYIYMRSLHLPCPTVSFLREAVERVGFFDETMRASEDRDMWLRIALHYEVALIPMVIAQYRTSPQAMTTDPKRMLDAQLRFVDKHFRSAGCDFWARRVALSRIYRQHAEALAERGALLSALLSASRGVALYPFDRNNVTTMSSLVIRSVRKHGA